VRPERRPASDAFSGLAPPAVFRLSRTAALRDLSLSFFFLPTGHGLIGFSRGTSPEPRLVAAGEPAHARESFPHPRRRSSSVRLGWERAGGMPHRARASGRGHHGVPRPCRRSGRRGTEYAERPGGRHSPPFPFRDEQWRNLRPRDLVHLGAEESPDGAARGHPLRTRVQASGLTTGAGAAASLSGFLSRPQRPLFSAGARSISKYRAPRRSERVCACHRIQDREEPI